MFGWTERQKTIRNTYRLFGQDLPRKSVETIDKDYSSLEQQFDLASAIMLSKDGLDNLSSRAMDLHLYLMHNARLKMIRHLLPAGEIILDLGGANSPLHKMGYPHEYAKVVLIDLPTEERHKDFQVELDDSDGKVFLRYEDMTDLKGIDSASVDLVWSGQSIEHVSPEQGIRMCKEAFRVLKPGGHFCLDTPNRLVTELHAATIGGGFIHPDHKIEYTPDQLRQVLVDAGFSIKAEWGICEMPLTVKARAFSYHDFLVGGAISHNINDSYVQFFNCEKPLS